MLFRTATKLIGTAALGAAVFFVLSDDSPILIESLESKTSENGPVFNKISYQKKNDLEVWSMQQSFKGAKAPPESWYQLKIDVNTKTRITNFYQFSDPDQLKPKSFGVSCFLCHSNGPRVIRPNYNSQEAPISLKNKIRIALWNYRIRNSGRLKPAPALSDVSGTPFRLPGFHANQKIELKACTKCHGDTGPRNPLTRQNFLSIRFLVEQGHMPPKRTLSPQEKKELYHFLAIYM